jgi:hypothetical protein
MVASRHFDAAFTIFADGVDEKEKDLSEAQTQSLAPFMLAVSQADSDYHNKQQVMYLWHMFCPVSHY